MACISSSRFCARAQEKLCQLLAKNNSLPIKSSSNSSVTGRPIGFDAAQSVRKFASLVSCPSGPVWISSSSTSVVSSSSSSSSSTSQALVLYNHDPGSSRRLHLGRHRLNGFLVFDGNGKRTFSTEAKTPYNHLQKGPNSSNTSSKRSYTKPCTNPSHPQCTRTYSSVHTQQPAGPVREIQVDPYLLLEDELKFIYDDIRKILLQATSQHELKTISSYYFDGQGKALRPMVVMLMARAINYHRNNESRDLLEQQRQVAIFAEMVHSASLVHDDVIDQSDFRRGKPSVNALWNHKRVTMAGDYILAISAMIIAGLKNNDVTIILTQILTDLVQGEFMQLGSKETENERFAHYLTKTYRKTASLIANTVKGAAVLGGAEESLSELAFQYGRNIGLAFQLVDDLLDFVSSAEAMGKPTAADLKLGLATAPVLFACEKFPELNPMIMRRFQEPGDVERAFELVHKSNGLEQTRFLARKHCIEAIRLAQEIGDSPYQKALCVVSDLVINRMK